MPRSELAVPLIAKNKLIGVLDLESEKAGYFRPEHLHLLTLTASRIAQAIENARLYSRVSRQAQTLTVLNEISAELTSILELDPLLPLHRQVRGQRDDRMVPFPQRESVFYQAPRQLDAVPGGPIRLQIAGQSLERDFLG